MSDIEFKSTYLYSQNALVEEDLYMSTTMYSVSWKYPSASSRTTARIRITCVYTKLGDKISVSSGIFEQWSIRGWMPIEEYFDDNHVFDSTKDFDTVLIDHAQSFLVGIPLTDISQDYNKVQDEQLTTDDFNTENVIEFSPDKNK